MDIDKGNQEELDINVDSLWLIGPRAKGGKRENNYHGNFVPQIPDQMIRRYTKKMASYLICLWEVVLLYLRQRHLDVLISDLT